MRDRTRSLLAGSVAFAALLTLLPEPNAAAGKPRLAHLLVREWLIDLDSSPLRAWLDNGRAPVLQVELRQSPPIVDETLRASKQQEYARCATEWATARDAAGLPTVLDASRGTLIVLVRVGTDGVRAELSLPDGRAATFQAELPTRLRLLLVCLAVGVGLGIAIAFLTQSGARRSTSSA